ncbi:DNA polymerase I [Candidatus Oleimmundimicrobium sp.]|uniref:DNA polymerase I n=1 Tax=Candidatus Oleimmundimicrobium sp. TaxID=3060597 RepID=UPI0027261758|nr:DNA polymerase I [Candidatus Oleimmundimicrobium sp.]MDO8886663.1 DNA polymerase I [Candidatus Oleimmundimicrobium sp.]
MQKGKIILIDGNSLVYRAFFALPTSLAISSGQITNAVYGFTSMLIKLIGQEKPDVILVAFDKGRSTRVKQYADYKAHRPKAPDELRSQFPLVKEVLKVLKIPFFEIEGYEADDILATLAKEAENEGDEVIIVTSDKDALQLVSPKTKIMTTKKGISDIVLYDKQAVIERYGVPPEKVVDFLGLKGDPSDNIPGIPGIGEKTATKLLQEFGSLENTLSNADKVSGKKLKNSLIEFKEQAILSKQLAILDLNSPIEINFEDYKLGNWNEKEVRELFSTLEFNTLLKRLLSIKFSNLIDEQNIELLNPKFSEPEEEKDWINLFKKIKVNRMFGLQLMTTESRDSVSRKVLKLALSFDDRTVYLIREKSLKKIEPYLKSDEFQKVVYDGKLIINSLKNENINLRGIVFDVMVAAYLINPLRNAYPLKKLSEEYLKASFSKEEGTISAGETLAILRLKNILRKELEKINLIDLFEHIEMPLIYVLAEMEWEGVGVDVDFLRKIRLDNDGLLKELEQDIYNLAGEKFNLNSPQQLGKILFEKLGLGGAKKTKTGYSTDVSVLNKLADAHPIVKKIMHYRELNKLFSTYILTLPKMVNPKTRRLHTSFNQAVTTTGRLSSSNPNLQNIPVKGELGKDIRRAFIPSRTGDELIVADYSQIELRILAHFSEDDNLVKAFKEGEDVHTKTASEVFSVSIEDIVPEMRRVAKAVNFGIIYGMSPFGLSEQLGISKEEAASYIESYFERYPKVKSYIDNSITQAYKNGYVETLLGRRRNLPELESDNYRIRSFGERLAVNFPIQGSAADIIKIAMIRLSNEIKKQGLQTQMILQVHDELVFEVPPLERGVFNLIKNTMENAYPLKVKMKVEIKIGDNWVDAKSI